MAAAGGTPPSPWSAQGVLITQGARGHRHSGKGVGFEKLFGTHLLYDYFDLRADFRLPKALESCKLSTLYNLPSHKLLSQFNIRNDKVNVKEKLFSFPSQSMGSGENRKQFRGKMIPTHFSGHYPIIYFH